MDPLDAETICQFLDEVGRRHVGPGQIFLIDGSALFLLGHSRPTLNIDYVGAHLEKSELQRAMDAVADEMHVDEVYLVHSQTVDLGKLAAMLEDMVAKAMGFDLNALDMRRHLEVVRARTARADMGEAS